MTAADQGDADDTFGNGSGNEWHHWNSLGAFLVRTGRYLEAGTAFESADEAAPTGITWPLENLASLELLNGNFDKAMAFLTPLVERATLLEFGRAVKTE